MLRFVLVALLATSACRESLEDTPDAPGGGMRQCMVVTTNPACVEAASMPQLSSTLTWIEQNIFNANCGGASCHGTTPGGTPPGGRIVLTMDAHPKLVNADTTLATAQKLVIPGNVTQSYLMVLMRHLTPEQAGAPEPLRNAYMPLGSPAVCCQKLDALAAWIMAGAQDN